MTGQNTDQSTFGDVPEAVVQKRKNLSIIWLIPLIAALIGGWLAYKALSEKGPTITITFNNAEGLTAGQTKIKYKNVEIGQVESLNLSEDLSHVVVTAELVKSSARYLTVNTRFWVVRARIAAKEVSGLGTLFSGAYIGLDPGKPGEPARAFQGLATQPIVTADLPGQHFTLSAKNLGSLDYGSPILFRQIEVGQVVAYELAKDGQVINVKIFIHAPHHERIRKNTRFWNASGLDVSLDASGITVNTESLMTLMLGGIAFETPKDSEPAPPVQEGDIFILHESYDKAVQKIYTRKDRYLVNFYRSVRGLEAGAPVEFRGVKIGQVINLTLLADYNKMEIQVPVVIEIEPERILYVGSQDTGDRNMNEILVKRGLRAQLQLGNLLTGQLYIDLDFHPDAPPGKIIYGGKYPELPTVPTTIEELTKGMTQIIKKLEKLPIEQIGHSFQETMNRFESSAERIDTLMQNLDEAVVPETIATLAKTRKTLVKVDRLLNAESPTGHELKRALDEIADAAHSISILAEFLEKHPESLIQGKGKHHDK